MSETGDQCQHNPDGATTGANNRGRCQLQVDRTPGTLIVAGPSRTDHDPDIELVVAPPTSP